MVGCDVRSSRFCCSRDVPAAWLMSKRGRCPAGLTTYIVLRYYRNTIHFMQKNLPLSDYRAMAELRYQIRRFLRFSENAARQEGIEPQQHQMLLALRGLPLHLKPTIGVL